MEPTEVAVQEIQTEEVEFKPEVDLIENEMQTEEIEIPKTDMCISTDPIVVETSDQEVGTDMKELNEQETQTEKQLEDMNFKTPDDVLKRKKSEHSEDKQPQANNRRSKGDYPCQIKRVVDFSKKSESSSESGKF